MTTLRCAVYTRKSSEEGLDQAFNSLDAQREAGLDYIRSQKLQGWMPVKATFDDGGFSGGSMERPALQRLLGEIRAGRVDAVVVYKVDRLSRSLADFARLMQTFDEHQVSFVSVTQQFNTTTSMGRLTLNMLLSFAQFEREVAGERIRDKIAATKRKGVWVCGQPPLGYRLPRDGDEGFTPGDRTLRIVASEAPLVRAIFEGYVELGSLIKLAQRLNAAGHRTRTWTSSRGVSHGGRPLTPHFIYGVLSNPVYIGQITHKRRRATSLPGNESAGTPRRGGAPPSGAASGQDAYPGLHQPIIDRALWERVHDRIAKVQRAARQIWTHTHLLKGILRTMEGFAMSPSSVQRPIDDTSNAHARAARSECPARSTGGTAGTPKRLVRYYVSQKAIKQGYASCPIRSVNAEHLDNLVRAVVMEHVRRKHSLDLGTLETSERDRHLRDVIHSVTIAPDALTIDLDHEQIAHVKAALAVKAVAARGDHTPAQSSPSQTPRPPCTPPCPFTPEVQDQGGTTRLALRIQIQRLDGRRVIVGPDGQDLTPSLRDRTRPEPREHIVHAIGLAYAWREELLRTGDPIDALARRWNTAPGRIHKLLPLTHLGPDLLARALHGRLPADACLEDLLAAAQNPDWSAQRVGSTQVGAQER